MFDALIREAASRFGLGDKAQMLVQMLLAYMTNKDTGGLAGFMDKFKSAGLGATAQSWLGGNSSSAQSATPSQIEQVLGGTGGLLGMLTSKLGITGPTATSALSFLLPAIMGKLTPGGSLPTSIPHDVTGFIGGAKDMLMGGAGAAAGMAGAGVHAASDAVAATRGGLMKWLPWIVAALAALFLLNYCSKPAVVETKKVAAPTPAPVVVAPAPAPAPVAAPVVADVIPAGAGVLAKVINGIPALNVYFDSGKTDIHPDWTTKSADLIKYLKDNAAVKGVISGFHDPQGNKAANEELAKNRAKGVAAALATAGIGADRLVMQKPAETAGSGGSNAEARRVEITVQK